MIDDTMIDLSDIPEIKDFSNVRKNPFAKRIKENGFSITVHYSSDDVARIIDGICNDDVDPLALDSEELAALERYKKRQQVKAISH